MIHLDSCASLILCRLASGPKLGTVLNTRAYCAPPPPPSCATAKIWRARPRAAELGDINDWTSHVLNYLGGCKVACPCRAREAKYWVTVIEWSWASESPPHWKCCRGISAVANGGERSYALICAQCTLELRLIARDNRITGYHCLER